MSKPRLLDLFCGAGGCSMGYHRAGFDVVGVDINPQPHYPFEFHQADAMTFPLEGFDVIHASPPCQAYSVLTPTDRKALHPDLIDAIRVRLQKSGRPYIIENVPGARSKLINPVMLCGTMFGLNTQRHRYFEAPWLVCLVPPCRHDKIPVVVSGTSKRLMNGKRRENLVSECREAMETPWMTRAELDQAIPPAYTEWIGRQLIEQIEGETPRR